MTPLRLLILAVLLYIGWLLIKGLFREKLSSHPGDDKNNRNGQAGKVEDVLVEDPVCHKLVPKKQAIRMRNSGKDIYFCSEQCCDQFSREAETRQQ